MLSAVLSCPHCNVPRMGFNVVADYQIGYLTWTSYWACTGCKGAVVLEVAFDPDRHGPDKPPSWYHEGDLLSVGFSVIRQYPEPRPINVPDYVPEPIAASYREATATLRAGHFTASAVLLRKVFERATRHLVDDGEALAGMDFYPRIEKLAKKHILTSEMQELAHLIRLDGNEAAHGDDPDEATATLIHQFTELFLVYVFELPARVRNYRDQATRDS